MSEAGKINRTVGWQYRETELREDVKLNLPKEWKLQVYEVTSGDSGKKYWVQILKNPNWRTQVAPYLVISLCTCNQGTFQQPLSVLGLKICCKHAANLIEFLKEKGKL